MTDTSTEAVELIRKYVDYPYTSPDTVILDSDLVTLTARDLADLLQERDQFKAQLTEARAQVAVAYEEAAKYHDEIFKHDSEGIEYSSLVGIPISNLGELESSCRRAEIDAKAIRALTPDHTTTALEQIRQQARDEGKREAANIAVERYKKWTPDGLVSCDVTACSDIADAILATLSADTQENSDE